MNAYCVNCKGEHQPASCPQKPSPQLERAWALADKSNLAALVKRHQRQTAPSAEPHLEGKLRGQADPRSLRMGPEASAMVHGLGHRFTLAHEQALGRALGAAQPKRNVEGRASHKRREQRELVENADKLLQTTLTDRLARAEVFLRRAVRVNPLEYHAHARLGHVLQQQRRWHEAAEEFEQAAGLVEQDEARVYQGSSHLMAARAHFFAGDMARAWTEACAAEVVIPRDGGVHYQKALIASHYPGADRSVGLCLERALELEPTYFSLAALDPCFTQEAWGEVVQPSLARLEQEGVSAVMAKHEKAAGLLADVMQVARAPMFEDLELEDAGTLGAAAQSKGGVGPWWMRRNELLTVAERSLEQGYAGLTRTDMELAELRRDLGQARKALRSALVRRIQEMAQRAQKLVEKGAGDARPLQRMAGVLQQAQAQLEEGAETRQLLQLERQASRDLGVLEEPRRYPRRRRVSFGWRHSAVYLALALTSILVLAMDLAALRWQVWNQNPFWITALCAWLTVLIPDAAARVAGWMVGLGWRGMARDLLLLPALLVFPVLPAALTVSYFHQPAVFVTAMAVCVLMSFTLVFSAQREG